MSNIYPRTFDLNIMVRIEAGG